MKRTFIAVKIEAGEKLEEMYYTLRSELKNDAIKWVDLNEMHITLAFLGDTEEETVKQVSLMLKKSCTGFGGINFAINGLGVFRNLNDPRVIWAGIINSGKLEELSGIIKNGLDNIGLVTEERQFKPHLTLGRIKWLKNRPLMEKLIGRYNNMLFQEVIATEVLFYESILQHSGPVYRIIEKFPF